MEIVNNKCLIVSSEELQNVRSLYYTGNTLVFDFREKVQFTIQELREFSEIVNKNHQNFSMLYAIVESDAIAFIVEKILCQAHSHAVVQNLNCSLLKHDEIY